MTAPQNRQAVPDSAVSPVRREQLVRSAVEVIARLGAERASVVKIAQHAGVSRGVVAYHFRDRADLLDAVVAEVYRLGGERLREPVATAATPREALLTFVGGSVEFYADHPEHIAALHEIHSAGRRDGGGRGDRPDHVQELTEVAALLRRGQRQGQFRAFDVEVMANVVRAVLDVAPVRLAAGADVAELRAELVAVVDAATRAVIA